MSDGAVEAGANPPDDPTFSVIMIYLNEERYLADAVASVLAQTGPSWELLLVDDGSTDRSADIAAALASEHPDRIFPLSHGNGVNRGMSASRNLGIAEARGRLITFLDADDRWLPDKLDAQRRLLDQHDDVDVLVSPAQWWRSWDQGQGTVDGPGSDWVQKLIDGDRPVVVNPPTLVEQFLEDEWRSICDLVISRRALELIGGYEPSFVGMFEDQVFHAKVLSQLPALVTTDWWYRYRQHPAACTAVAHQHGEHRRSRLAFLDWLDGYLATNGSLDPALKKAVRRHRRQLRHPVPWRGFRLARRLIGHQPDPDAGL